MFEPGAEEAEQELTEAEIARRERARERSSGVTAYATDDAVRRGVFTVGGRMPRRGRRTHRGGTSDVQAMSAVARSTIDQRSA